MTAAQRALRDDAARQHQRAVAGHQHDLPHACAACGAKIQQPRFAGNGLAQSSRSTATRNSGPVSVRSRRVNDPFSLSQDNSRDPASVSSFAAGA